VHRGSCPGTTTLLTTALSLVECASVPPAGERSLLAHCALPDSQNDRTERRHTGWWWLQIIQELR
jgi:hypothetical protein